MPDTRFDPSGKLALAPQFSAYMRGERVYPINLEISPSGVCQATCTGCFYAQGDLGGFRKEFLQSHRAALLFTEARELGVKSITWTGGGDPSLHPNIEGLVAGTYIAGLEQGMFTNALAMPKYDPSLLTWIRITMTDRPYKQSCIKPLRAAKTLGFAFNYSGPQDDAYLCETLNLADRVGADYVQLRPKLPFHGATIDITPPAIHHPLLQVTEYKFEQAKHKHSYKDCEAYHLGCFIWETADVSVCAYMRQHEGYMLGNLYKDTLKDILDRAPASVPVSPACQTCCKPHETNLMIHHARSLRDVNFP